VATVWLFSVGVSIAPWLTPQLRLVATLGAKSVLKKVTRKAILDVNVPKACKTIQDPSAPMALRLQGNLLYASLRAMLSSNCD
jgi:hypothetical protein